MREYKTIVDTENKVLRRAEKLHAKEGWEVVGFIRILVEDEGEDDGFGTISPRGFLILLKRDI